MVALPAGITTVDGKPRLDGVTIHGLGTRKNDQLLEAVVDGGVTEREALEQRGADVVVDDLAELVEPR